MKKTIIIDGRKYFYTDGKVRKELNEFDMNMMYVNWKRAGLEVHRKRGMGGRVEWIWIEEG